MTTKKTKKGVPRNTPTLLYTSDMTQIVCSKLKEIRKEAELTQEGFAKKINIGIPYVKGIEQMRFAPSHDVVAKIAKTFKVSVNWIYGMSSVRELPKK